MIPLTADGLDSALRIAASLATAAAIGLFVYVLDLLGTRDPENDWEDDL